ncbi:MAG: hypothetical protein ACJAS3_003115 [Roseivirga sp.]|jgi:hypothetical protein
MKKNIIKSFIASSLCAITCLALLSPIDSMAEDRKWQGKFKMTYSEQADKLTTWDQCVYSLFVKECSQGDTQNFKDYVLIK